MSSVPNPAVRPQGVPGPSRRSRRSKNAAHKSTEQVRQSLHAFLIKTSSFIKFLDAMVLLFAWLATWLGLWLVACVVDHWLLPLPSLARWAFWSLGVASAGWWIAWQLLPLIVRRVNPVYAAKRIEHVVPEFKNGLVSWLELESMPNHGVPRGVMSQLTHRAAHFLGDQDPSTTIDTSPLIKLIGGVLLLLTSLAVYTMLSPKSVVVTGKRILLPWSSVMPPSRVHILDVKPGSIELTQGKPLPVDVELKGLRRGEPVTVRFSTLDGQITNRRIELKASTEGFRYVGAVTTNSQGVETELDYWIEAGDAQSGPYRVQISPLPSVVLKSVELRYPAYTRLATRIVAGDKVEAVEGTTAKILASANQTMSRGRLEINPDVGADGELIRAASFAPMSVDGRELQADWLMQLNTDKDNPTTLNYRIRGFNQRGDANPRPILHSMSVLADVAPEITLVGPENRLLRVRENAQVNLEIRASDPDFGLDKIALEFSRNGIPGRGVTVLEADGVRGRQVKTYRIELAKWQAKIGDRFQIRATAWDNRHDPVSGEPAANSAESQPLLLQVVGPEEIADVEDSVQPSPPTQDPQNRGSTEAAGNPSQTTNDGNGSSNNSQSEQQASNDPSNNSNAANSESGSSPESTKPTTTDPNENGGGENSQQPGSTASGQETSSNNDPNGQAGSAASGAAGQSSSNQNGTQSETSSGGSSGGQSQSNDSGGQSSQRSGDSSASSNGQSRNSSSTNSGSPAAGSQGDSSNNTAANSERNVGSPQSTGGGAGSESQAPRSDGEVIERVRQHMQSQESSSSSTSDGQSSDGQSQNSQSQNSQSQNSQSQNSQSQNSQPQGSPAQNGQPAGDPAGSNGGGTQKPSASSDSASQAGETSSGDGSSGSPEKTDGNPQNAGNSGEQSAAEQSPSPNQGANSDSTAPASQNSSAESPQSNKSQSGDSQSPGSQGGSSPQSSNSQSSNSQSSNSQSGNSQSGNSQSGNSQSGNSPAGDQAQPSGSQSSDSASTSQDSPSASGGDSQSAGNERGDPASSSNSQSGSSTGGKPESSSSDSSPSGTGAAEQESGSQSSSDSSAGQQSPSESGSQSQPEGAGSGASTNDNRSQPAGSGGESPASSHESASERPTDGSTAAGSRSSSGQSSQNGSQSASPSSPSGPRGNSAGGGMTSGQPTGGGSGSEGGEGGSSGVPAEVDRDYAERTTQMVLDYLNRQKEQPDPELLRDLDWTDRDLNEFVDRWNRARDLSQSGDERDRLKWQEMLESLELGGAANRVRQGTGLNDTFQQMQDSGSRMQFPESLRKRFEAYNKALERSRR